MAHKTLKLETAGDVATITLNRPDKRNAISNEMIEDLHDAFGEVETGDARILILTGAGNAFCSGMDLDALRAIADQSPVENIEDSRRMAQLFRRIWSYPKMTIAAVNGAAVAGGCGMATLCDFTLAVPNSKFGYTEVRIGFIPAIVSVFLTRQIGEKHARDMLFTGRIIEAAEAYRIGLVTQIVPPEQLISAANELAGRLAANSPTSLVKTKNLLYDMAAADLDRDLELAIAENAQIRSTPDFHEGISSFLEKRAPKWTAG